MIRKINRPAALIKIRCRTMFCRGVEGPHRRGAGPWDAAIGSGGGASTYVCGSVGCVGGCVSPRSSGERKARGERGQ